jgi:predicted MPP superfamily phosphohydrolase
MPFFYRSASLASIAHRYIVGLYRRDDATLYVHPGLGTTGPPMRLGIVPEVTILVLRRGRGPAKPQDRRPREAGLS